MLVVRISIVVAKKYLELNSGGLLVGKMMMMISNFNFLTSLSSLCPHEDQFLLEKKILLFYC